MKRYDVISLIALLILAAALPIYLLQESNRMDHAQTALREQFVVDGAMLYVENCILCHGPTGDGVGAMPALNHLSSADSNVLYKTIALAPHGSAMASWHIDEGGSLNDYQITGLVTLIQDADWPQVDELASTSNSALYTSLALDTNVDMMAMEGVGEDPHECRACHEEPEVHADRFGLNCARCHTLQAWKPALLTRHTFLLDHGGEGQVACQTCHTRSYSEHTCYECHDHTPEQMEEAHAQENIFEFNDCAVCHPTGQEGEGELFRRNYYEGFEAEGEPGYHGIQISQGTQENELVLKVGQVNIDR
ncbi:MAG: hypothetical protein GY832_43205 [Chloroflexi bacterium]|nr:hypothetical protein [Chloroflexota bacterium]